MLQNSSMFKTIELFFRNPNKNYSLSDISREIGIAHTSVKNNLDELADKNIIIKLIEKKKTRNFPFYKANIISKEFKKYKIIFNIILIKESGLIEFIEDKIMPKSIVLFGSYSRGEDDETSDIDLFVQGKTEDINIEKFEKKLGRKIEIHFNEKFLSFSKELKNNIINGIMLSGYLEGYK